MVFGSSVVVPGNHRIGFLAERLVPNCILHEGEVVQVQTDTHGLRSRHLPHEPNVHQATVVGVGGEFLELVHQAEEAMAGGEQVVEGLPVAISGIGVARIDINSESQLRLRP